jgi:hypothetical protein
MAVEEATHEFTVIYEEVFTDTSLSRVERSKKLKGSIESLLKRHNLPSDTRLLRESTKPWTRTYVNEPSYLKSRVYIT